MEGQCPNCGAPIEMNQSANCTHCKALLRSGEYDWVLTEITQESEWHVPGRATLPGVAALRNRDPEFDTVSVEDRASVMFWRKATADRIGKIDPLRKIASPEFSQKYAVNLKASAVSSRTIDCAVGSVESLGVIPGDQRDRALVLIKWSGHRLTAEPDGAGQGRGEDVWAATIFVLSRMSDVKTDLGKSISSAHCPNCGAPESGGVSNACEFCGTVLNDGRHGWVLDDVMNQNSTEVRSLINDLRSQNPTAGSAPAAAAAAIPNLRGLVAWMVKVATADGSVDPREKTMLLELASRWKVAPEELETMIAAGLRGNLSVADPHNIDEARSWVRAMASEAWADGQITREEMELLRGVATRAGLSEEEVKQIVTDAKSRLYKEAAQALRGKRED